MPGGGGGHGGGGGFHGGGGGFHGGGGGGWGGRGGGGGWAGGGGGRGGGWSGGGGWIGGRGGPGWGGPGWGGPGWGGGWRGGWGRPCGPPLPFVGALAAAAVVGTAVATYPGHPHVVYVDGSGRRVETTVNRLVVTVNCAGDLKNVQWIGGMDPYVQATLLYNNSHMATARSTAHHGGGCNPLFIGRNNVFTFMVPATCALNELKLVLELLNENWVSDDVIGATGQINAEELCASGGPVKFNVSTGGFVEVSAQLLSPDSAPARQQPAGRVSAPAAATRYEGQGSTNYPMAEAYAYPVEGEFQQAAQPPPQNPNYGYSKG